MTSDCMDDRQGEAMKPSPSPAATVTPSQSDVEAAREWLFKHYGFRNLNVMSHEVDALASLLASRGTRALTEEERALVDDFKQAQREYPNASFSSKWHKGLLAIISRLTGEPSA